MQYAEIRARLADKGYNFAMLAEVSGYSLVHVTQVARGISQSSKVEEIISKAIDLPAEKVFGKRVSPAEIRAKRVKELHRAISSQVA